MAEIKIEKKKSIWPWILLALGILALLYFFVIKDDDTDDVTSQDDIEYVEETEETDMDNADMMLTDAAKEEIRDFKAFIENDGEMGLDHEYSNKALIKLIDATSAVANALNVDIEADLASARENAASITKDPYEVDHANKIRNAGSILVGALKKIQMQKFPDLNKSCTMLQSSLMEIEPDEKTLNQKDEVRDFFEQAGDLLTNMINK